jgi:hypothetical protein
VRPSKQVSISLRIGSSERGCFPKSIRIFILEEGSPPPPEGSGVPSPLPIPSTTFQRASSSSEFISGLSLTLLLGVLG